MKHNVLHVTPEICSECDYAVCPSCQQQLNACFHTLMLHAFQSSMFGLIHCTSIYGRKS